MDANITFIRLEFLIISLAPHFQPSLYVGNLSAEITEQHLQEKFGSIGVVQSIRILRDSMTRRSLGYAYVNYGSAEHAQQAIHEFNNEQFFGAPMRVMPCVRDPQLRKCCIF